MKSNLSSEDADKLVRAGGNISEKHDTLLGRALAEQVDDYLMKIYRLVKAAYPEKIGFDAQVVETVDENGEDDVIARFWFLSDSLDVEEEDGGENEE